MEIKTIIMDLEYEAHMAQSRMLSPFVCIMETKGYNYDDLAEKSGIERDRLKEIFMMDKYITIEEIAKIQDGLNVIAQSPLLLTKEEHSKKYYGG